MPSDRNVQNLGATITRAASLQTYTTVRLLVDRARARRCILDRLARLGLTDVEENIKFEMSYTPLSWCKRYNLMKGSTQLAYFRPSNRHPRYRNLYFVGASTHPGTGVATALVSARLASQRTMEEASGWAS